MNYLKWTLIHIMYLNINKVVYRNYWSIKINSMSYQCKMALTVHGRSLTHRGLCPVGSTKWNIALCTIKGGECIVEEVMQFPNVFWDITVEYLLQFFAARASPHLFPNNSFGKFQLYKMPLIKLNITVCILLIETVIAVPVVILLWRILRLPHEWH